MKDFAMFQPNEQPQNNPIDWEEEVKRLARTFHGKGEGELMRAILERAVEGKKNGTLTNEQIDAFYAQFSPMLDSAKKKKLQKIIERLKNM